jgi:hypothetical protein
LFSERTKMDFLTEPSVREMFIYFVLTLAALMLPTLAALSPVIIEVVIDALRGKG